MRFPPDWVDEVRARNDIVDVIGSYIALKPRGSKHWGLCPFHGEKTPSFSVDKDKQLYYCFGCHTGGNLFHFVMAMERVDFQQAVTLLAERAHMPLPQLREDPDYQKKQAHRARMYEACKAAAHFFHDQLFTAGGKQAREYLQGRGLNSSVITRFGLGYAPDSWDALLTALTAKGFDAPLLKDCGLVHQKEDRYYDAFRDRVMFPILDERGRVCAFGGRVMGKGTPKYLNSPETQVFNKRNLLYGMHAIKERSLPRILVVEGYMDVVGLSKFGVDKAVASLGTALTSEQARLIKRVTDRVLLCYDGDNAGQNATLRGIDILQAEGLTVRVVSLPEGKDPDEYVKAYGPERFLSELDAAMEPIAFRLEKLKANHDLSTEEGRTDYAIAGAALVAAEDNPVARENHIRRMAVATGYQREVLLSQVEQARGEAGKTPQPQTERELRPARRSSGDPKDGAAVQAEAALLRVIAEGRSDPGLRSLEEAVFDAEANRQLLRLMNAMQADGETLTTAKVLGRIEDEQLAAEAARLFATELPLGDEDQYIRDCIDLLKKRAMNRRAEQLTLRIQSPELDAAQRAALARELQQVLTQIRSGK